MKIEMQEVKSSHIESIGRLYGVPTLFVKFKKGAVYSYDGVSEYLFDEFLEAASVGRFFAEHIKNDFTYTKHVTFTELDGVLEIL